MKSFFKNDYFFNDIYEITPQLLKELGISAIVADLDNTIADYDTPVPTKPILIWIEGMRESGVKIAIVSNNKKARVEKFCEGLDLPHYWKSGKPGKKTIHLAMSQLGASKETTAMLGDKFTTDVIGAHLSGIKMLQVRSIKPRWKRRAK